MKSGPFLIEQNTCVDFCPTGWVANDNWECIQSDQEYCQNATINAGSNTADCDLCLPDHTLTGSPGVCVSCGDNEEYTGTGSGCNVCLPNEYKDENGDCTLCSTVS